MFEIKIRGIYEAQLLVEQGWPTKIISLVDPGTNLHKQGDHHIIKHMHDVSSKISEDWVLPEREQFEDILEFSKSFTNDDKVLVHCHMGISRSTATAIGVCIQHGMSYQEAYSHIARIRECLMPNMLLCNYIDEKFGFEGKMRDFILANRTQDRQRKADQIIDEAHSLNKSDTDAMTALLLKIQEIDKAS